VAIGAALGTGGRTGSAYLGKLLAGCADRRPRAALPSELRLPPPRRRCSAYRSGRSPDWLKMKNPEASAVKREAEEDWSKERWR
jgi:hypothetical protein